MSFETQDARLDAAATMCTLGSITSCCSGNETEHERTAEIEPMCTPGACYVTSIGNHMISSAIWDKSA